MTSTTAPQGRVDAQLRAWERARAGRKALSRRGAATFTYAGREYSLPLDVSGRHSIAPGMYSYENGVRTALL